MNFSNKSRRMHPLMVITAVSLTTFSLLGIAAITGVINPARSNTGTESFQVAMPVSDADAKKLETANSASDHKTASTSADKPASESTARHTHSASREAPGNNAGSNTVNKPIGASTPHAAVCNVCGKIASIQLVKQDGDASGLGAVAGGVAGGLLGNQVGKGKGNVLMTILGAGGGAYAGHTIEKKVKSTESYLVKVRMNDGSTRNVTMNEKPEFAVGDPVKVINGGVTVLS
jgi:outer membrane lipoprotein SlyB